MRVRRTRAVATTSSRTALHDNVARAHRGRPEPAPWRIGTSSAVLELDTIFYMFSFLLSGTYCIPMLYWRLFSSAFSYLTLCNSKPSVSVLYFELKLSSFNSYECFTFSIVFYSSSWRRLHSSWVPFTDSNITLKLWIAWYNWKWRSILSPSNFESMYAIEVVKSMIVVGGVCDFVCDSFAIYFDVKMPTHCMTGSRNKLRC